MEEHRRELLRAMFLASPGVRAFPRWLEELEGDLAARYRDVEATREFKDVLSGMRADRHKPIEVFIIGEGNFGKSTLLNAVLGEALSKVYFLPNTSAFLRFVPKTNPSQMATLFVRLEGDQHNWLSPQLGELRPSDELPALQTCIVKADTAEQLLQDEARRLKDRPCHYTAAIVEVEREVALRERGALPATARLVDTPGLNQLLPGQDDCEKHDGRTTAERFRQWLRETPQGRHLAWQVRRCDVILWVVDARKSTSEVTRVALDQLRQYGKPSLMAATKVDLIQGGSDEVARVLRLMDANLGRYVEGIVKVDAKRAQEAALVGDEIGLKESGLRDVAALLVRLAIENGAVSRARARYWSLRATEEQMRRAHKTLSEEIQRELAHAGQDRSALQRLHEKQLGDLADWETRLLTQEGDVLTSKIECIERGSTPNAILQHVNAGATSSAIRVQAQAWLREADDELLGLGEELAKNPYSMPFFDPHGERQKDSRRVEYRINVSQVDIPGLEFVLSIDSILVRWAKRKWEDFNDWLPWGDRTHGQRALESLRHDLNAQVLQQLTEHVRRARGSMAKELERRRDETIADIEKVLDALGAVEGRPLTDTQALVDKSLGRPIVPPLFPHRVLQAVKAHPICRFLEPTSIQDGMAR